MFTMRVRSQPDESGVVRAGLNGRRQRAGLPFSGGGVLRLNAPCIAVLAIVGLAVGFLSGL